MDGSAFWASAPVRSLHAEPGTGGSSCATSLAAAGIDPASLIVEITEGIAMDDTEAALGRLREIKALGVRLAIDDFGTVAEGVEHQAQAAALRRMGCAQAQGFYFARPMAADEMTALLSSPVAALPRVG